MFVSRGRNPRVGRKNMETDASYFRRRAVEQRKAGMLGQSARPHVHGTLNSPQPPTGEPKRQMGLWLHQLSADCRAVPLFQELT